MTIGFDRYAWQKRPLVPVFYPLGKPMPGWPPGLLQDDNKKLSNWLASRLDSLLNSREAAAAIRRTP